MGELPPTPFGPPTAEEEAEFAQRSAISPTEGLDFFCVRCKQPLGRFEITQFGNKCAGCVIDAIDFDSGEQPQ